MADTSVIEGFKLYGLDLSYFTGKLDAYVRYSQIPHERIEFSLGSFAKAGKATGLRQMPAIELPDGRWMSDTSPMIEWLDARLSIPSVLPNDPVTRFFTFFVEDYADEWMWRPALHYRWSFAADADLMSYRIAAEMMRDMPLPHFIRKAIIKRRQINTYVKADGTNKQTRAHIEDIYLRNLDWLQAIFEKRPYLLGERPSLADFGYFASMFRHFGLDPTPAMIMRNRAPAVYEWLGRLWNAKAENFQDATLLEGGVPADWHPILKDAGLCYLPYLAANADAHLSGKKKFTLTLEGTTYNLPVHRYRVHCLDKLQTRFDALDQAAQSQVQAILEETGCWEPFWRVPHPQSGFDVTHRAPFFTPETVWSS